MEDNVAKINFARLSKEEQEKLFLESAENRNTYLYDAIKSQYPEVQSLVDEYTDYTDYAINTAIRYLMMSSRNYGTIRRILRVWDFNLDYEIGEELSRSVDIDIRHSLEQGKNTSIELLKEMFKNAIYYMTINDDSSEFNLIMHNPNFVYDEELQFYVMNEYPELFDYILDRFL